MIESAFEGAYMYEDCNEVDSGVDKFREEYKLMYDEYPSDDLVNNMTKAVKFNKRTTTPTGRLRKIMKNIVKNNGEFLP
jgi:hypothetical protein